MTATSVPTTDAAARAQMIKKGQAQNKGQSSSKSWDFLVHGALL